MSSLLDDETLASAATVDTVDSKAPASDASRPEPSSAASTGTSPADALLMDEVARTRAFLLVTFVFLGVMPVLLPYLHGDPTVTKMLYVVMAVCVVPAIWLYVRLRDPSCYTPSSVVPVMTFIAVTTCLGVYYWGIYSAGPCIVVMGIHYFSRAQSFGAALFIYLVCAGIQAVLVVLVLTGLLADRGIFDAGDLSLLERCTAQVLVQVVYGLTFWLARSARRTTLEAITKLERAVRQVAQREALLQEARQDLDRALVIGGAGRYTDQTLGSYRLGSLIGRGAMAEVYEASHTGTGEPAAVKLLHSNVLDDPKLVVRFLREASVAGALQSAHVVRVVEWSEPTDPLPYLAMERLHGHDLAKQLRDTRRLPSRLLLQLVREVGTVVDLARREGIVHRDLKPQNIFLATQPNGEPIYKVLDFGVSKLAEHTGTLTQGGVVGTPGYMAPEQARGEDVDYRADLYALAAIAYRCVTGRPPFLGKDVAAVLYNVVYSAPARPSEVASVSADYDAVLAIGMAKKREDRFESAAAFAEALAAAAAGGVGTDVRRHAERLAG